MTFNQQPINNLLSGQISKNKQLVSHHQMKDIATYSISRLQRAFELPCQRNNYLYVANGREPLYNEEPFRTETYSILLLKSGEMHFKTNLTSYNISGPAIITIGPTVIRSFYRTDSTPNMEILFFKDSFLLETRANIFYLNRYHFFEDDDLHVLSLHEPEQNRLAAVFDLINDSYDKDLPHEPLLMRSYAYLLIHEIAALHCKYNIQADRCDNSSIFIKFRGLLVKEFWRHRSVGFYADRLNVSPKYFSEAIKKQTGKTASEWIDDAVLLEAKVLLQDIDLSIAQISNRLNFSDQSVFGKFFKTHTCLSPIEYRKAL